MVCALVTAVVALVFRVFAVQRARTPTLMLCPSVPVTPRTDVAFPQLDHPDQEPDPLRVRYWYCRVAPDSQEAPDQEERTVATLDEVPDWSWRVFTVMLPVGGATGR